MSTHDDQLTLPAERLANAEVPRRHGTSKRGADWFRRRMARKENAGKLRRRGLFFIAPGFFALSLCLWWGDRFYHSHHTFAAALSITAGIAEALVKEGVTFGLLALAASLVLSSGYVDLSQAGVMAVTGAIFATLTQSHHGLWALALALLCGALLGALLGFLITKQMDPLITTWSAGSILVLMMVAYGGSGWVDGQETSIALGFEPDAKTWLFGGSAFNWALVATLVIPVLQFSNLPRFSRAVGANSESARFAGVNVNGTIVAAYSVGSTLVALASIFACYRLGSARTVRAESVELISIAIAVLGGTSMKGGHLSMTAVFCAAGLWVSVRQQLVPITFPGVAPGQDQRVAEGLFSMLLVLCLVIGRFLWRERTRTIRVTD